MKRYILLRNNEESGPYTLQELRVYGLAPTDLVWVEDESTAWNYPTDITGLRTIVKGGIKKPLPNEKHISAPLTSALQDRTTEEEQTAAPNYISFEDRGDEFHPLYATRRKGFRMSDSMAFGARFFGFVVLLIGGVLFGFVFVNMAKQFGVNTRGVSNAVEIKSETLAPHTSAHAALGAQSLPAQPMAATASFVSVDSTQLKPMVAKKKTVQQSPIKPQPAAANDPDTAEKSTAKLQADLPEDRQAAAEPAEEKPAPAQQTADRAPSLQLSANDYKVGLFGGISNLEISVNNPSSQKIDRATVEVEYLKPNGSVAKSQNVLVEDIGPKDSKTVSVPSSNRGVKVRYRVVSVSTPGGDR